MKETKKVFLWVILIVVLLFFSFLLNFFVNIKKSLFLGFSRLNFVYVDETKVPLVFSFEGKEGEILTFSKDIRVQVARNFGEYELSKVFALGELDKKGGPLLKETIQENFNIAVFGYFYDEKASASQALGKPKSLINKILWRALRGKNASNLNKYDLLVLYFRSLSLDQSQVKVNKFDSADNSLADQKITNESFSIEILNATTHNGLAQTTANLLEKAGGRVVRSADAQREQANCEIQAKEEAISSYSIKWLKFFFPCQIKSANEGTRADITLVLGWDYWKNANEKW